MPEEGDSVGGACVERDVQHQRIKQHFVLLRLCFFVEELEGERGGGGAGGGGLGVWQARESFRARQLQQLQQRHAGSLLARSRQARWASWCEGVR